MFTVNLKVKNKDPKAFEKLKKRIDEITSKKVVAGFPKGKLNNPHYDNGASIIDVAIWNEFGTNRIPRRDFLGPATERWHEFFKAAANENCEDLLTGKMDIDKFFNIVGMQGASFISKSIVKLDSPPNAPSTVRRKGSNNPLVDTGDLAKAPVHEIRRKNK